MVNLEGKREEGIKGRKTLSCRTGDENIWQNSTIIILNGFAMETNAKFVQVQLFNSTEKISNTGPIMK